MAANNTQPDNKIPTYVFHDGYLTTTTPTGRLLARPLTKSIAKQFLNVLQRGKMNLGGHLQATDAFVGNVNHYLRTGVEYEPQDAWKSKYSRGVIFSPELVAELKKFK